jgi:mono/diheme cytochrome c family protein
MKRRVRFAIYAALLFAFAGACVALYLLFNGPRMKVQEHVLAYQKQMPPTPAGVLPVSDPYPPPLTADSAAPMTNPLKPTAENTAHGRTYYGYYCAFCHGQAGDGNGPVGESYDPPPADLRAAEVQSLGDGALLRASLTGLGHEPVLERVVPEEARWPIVLYVRSLAAGTGAKP